MNTIRRNQIKNGDDDNNELASIFWVRYSDELQSSGFWADRIESLRGESFKRIRRALEKLPLPAAFREAAIAAREIIREKIKNHQDYEEDLALLYWLAALNSFSVPYSELLQEPGYNVIESVPEKTLKGLLFTYQDLGYEQLVLLNKTDRKRMVELWGYPKSHSTLHEIHHDLWCEYEQKFKAKRPCALLHKMTGMHNKNHWLATLPMLR